MSRTYRTFQENCRNRTWYFPVVADYPGIDMRRVYPLKQKFVCKMIDLLKETPWITKAVLFGSSLSNACHIDSDTDLAVWVDFEYLKSHNMSLHFNGINNIDIKGTDILIMNNGVTFSDSFLNNIEKGLILKDEQTVKEGK